MYVFRRITIRLTPLGAKEGTVKRGIKEVVKYIRKNSAALAKEKNRYGLNQPCFSLLPDSFVLIAADISPIDVITHLPVMCEETKIPYVYVPSKEKLGHSSKTKRATSCVLVTKPTSNKDVAEKFDEALANNFPGANASGRKK